MQLKGITGSLYHRKDFSKKDILAKMLYLFNQKGCHMVHWIKGKLYAKKIKVLTQEKRKWYAYIVAYRGALGNQNDLLGFIISYEDCMQKIKGLNQ